MLPLSKLDTVDYFKIARAKVTAACTDPHQRADGAAHCSATSIIVEATLSFLGLGTQPPTPSWGWDLKANLAFIQDNLWLSLFPGLAILVTVLGFNLFGDGLRDALDPRLK
jgi:ABC-type dipeptide/oligopeptide/nickel transport system permease subunit